MDRGEDVFVLDVREPHEYEINRIPGSTLIPLGDLAERFTELDANREIVAQCKSGMRSARAAAFLRDHGFKNVEEPQGRHPGLGRPGRSEPAEVLKRARAGLSGQRVERVRQVRTSAASTRPAADVRGAELSSAIPPAKIVPRCP